MLPVLPVSRQPDRAGKVGRSFRDLHDAVVAAVRKIASDSGGIHLSRVELPSRKFLHQHRVIDFALGLRELDQCGKKSSFHRAGIADDILRIFGWLGSPRLLTVAVFLVVGSGLLRIDWLLFHWCSPMVRFGSYGAGESCGSREELDTREMLGGFL